MFEFPNKIEKTMQMKLEAHLKVHILVQQQNAVYGSVGAAYATY